MLWAGDYATGARNSGYPECKDTFNTDSYLSKVVIILSIAAPDTGCWSMNARMP